MTYCCIDSGNTLVKVVVYDSDQQELATCKQPDIWVRDITALRKQYDFDHVIMSSTRHVRKPLLEHLTKHYQFILLTHETAIPITNTYDTPETLGRDRLAASVGAWSRQPKATHLIIDAGTCITYDVVHAGKYLGGNISPGIHMRLQAMHHFTDKLPEPSMQDTGRHLGSSTEEALQNGALLGTICEIESFIQRTQAIYRELQVSFTGGDATYLADRIECDIFVAPNLVLEGLYTILRYNAD